MLIKESTLVKVSLNANELAKLTKWKDAGETKYSVSLYRENDLIYSVWFSTEDNARKCLKSLLIFETILNS